MHNHQQLPQQLPQQTQQIPQQLQQLPMQQLPQQQQFQPKAVGTTPLPAPHAFHQERVPAPELVQAPEPVKSAALPREAPPLEVSPEPRQERPEEAPERKEKEKYVPPVKRYSQGDRERLERPERTEKAEKREEKVEKVEKAEKQEKRFEAAAIERRRHSQGPRMCRNGWKTMKMKLNANWCSFMQRNRGTSQQQVRTAGRNLRLFGQLPPLLQVLKGCRTVGCCFCALTR